MQHPYEYRSLLKYASFQMEGLPNPEQEVLDLNKELGKLASELPKALSTMPDAEGWEVNSHSLALVGNTLLVSILLQRPRIHKADH